MNVLVVHLCTFNNLCILCPRFHAKYILDGTTPAKRKDTVHFGTFNCESVAIRRDLVYWPKFLKIWFILGLFLFST